MRFLVCAAACVVLLFSGSAFCGEVRTWSDRSGQVKIEGELIKLTNSRITLKTTSGETKSLPIVALSATDRIFLNKLSEADRNRLMGEASEGAATEGDASAAKHDLKVNDKVSVDWKGTWYPATILEVRPDGYKIHYDGYSNSWDEVVPLERMRPRNSEKPFGGQGGTSNSGDSEGGKVEVKSVYVYRIEPQLKVGDKITAEWSGGWYPATVVTESLPAGYKVHFETFQTPDEVVPFERIRPRNSTKPYARFLVRRPAPDDPQRLAKAEVVSSPNSALASAAPTAKPGSTPVPTGPFPINGDREVVIDLKAVSWFNLPAHAMKTGLPLVAGPRPEMNAIPEKRLALGACEKINGAIEYGDQLLVAGMLDSDTKLVACDFRKGSVSLAGSIGGNHTPLDADPVTGQIITQARDDLTALYIWKTDGAEKVCKLRLKTFDPKIIKEEFIGAKFLTGNRVALDAGYSLWDRHTIIFDIDKRVIVAGLRGCRPGVSSDRRYLALTNGLTVAVYDTVELHFAAVFERGAVRSSFLSFSPDSKWLVYVAEREAVIYSLSTGEQVTALSFQGAVPHGREPIWLPNNHLLLGNMMLFNLRAGMATWNYSLYGSSDADHVAQLGEQTCYVAQEGTAREGRIERVACSVKLPHEKINETIRSAKNPLFCLQPGAEVAIDVALDDLEQQKRVYQVLKERAEASGWKVVSHAKVVIKATVDYPEGWSLRTHDEQWRSHYILMVRTRVLSVTIDDEGSEIWRNETSVTPNDLYVSDITKQQYKARFQSVPYEFFDEIRFPTHLPVGKFYGGFGVTSLASDGKLK